MQRSSSAPYRFPIAAVAALPSALAVGDLAVVKGARQSDGSILAMKVTVGGQEQDEVE